ncbi:histidinol-phosphate transaminase [Cohnella zeiphila]|uniref:Histidinol-phosphate aminotransferase n=1 Tax=Cohnella zeiphila TaxID=2761120 RepID=A0A7X0VZ88_9BACL|nr:histidinol-phosphate transaminase [Cohnella zeiphila]MBB6735475.1 histidinol-phosphate transaminase [Cohnella zeiphila]
MESNDLRVSPRRVLADMTPYTAGKPIWEVQREYGLDRVVKLASNENPLGPSPKALEAIQSLLPDLHRYPDERAFGLLRALSERLRLPEECLIVTNGGDELITLLSEAYLEPGDEVVVPSPTFSEYAFGARLMNATPVPVPLREGYRFSTDDLLAAVTERTKLVYLCTPNNPTGTYLPGPEMRRLLDSLPRRVLVVIDSAYAHFATAPDYDDGMAYVREGRPVVVLQTFSKIYGLAGIRVGYGAAPAEIVRSLLQVKEPFNVNALAQAAAAAALADDAHLEASRRVNEEGRKQLYDGLTALGIPYIESMSNFILAEPGERAAGMFEALMAKGVILRSGKGWNLPRHVRISVGTREENKLLLSELAAFMKSS